MPGLGVVEAPDGVGDAASVSVLTDAIKNRDGGRASRNAIRCDHAGADLGDLLIAHGEQLLGPRAIEPSVSDLAHAPSGFRQTLTRTINAHANESKLADRAPSWGAPPASAARRAGDR